MLALVFSSLHGLPFDFTKISNQLLVVMKFCCRYGSWAVCYTYGTWFGVKGLVAAGRSFSNSSTVRKACEFLLSKQLPCGGWGESYLSCQNKVDNFTSVLCLPYYLFTCWCLNACRIYIFLCLLLLYPIIITLSSIDNVMGYFD